MVPSGRGGVCASEPLAVCVQVGFPVGVAEAGQNRAQAGGGDPFQNGVRAGEGVQVLGGPDGSGSV